jgi:hypothetical protein
MLTPRIIIPILLATGGPVRAETLPSLANRLQALAAPGPVSATLRLDLRLERTLHGKTAGAEASLEVDVDQDDASLRVRWAPSLLKAVDAEERQADQEADRLVPLREAVKELDPARIGHLLDQVHTLLGIARGAPVEDRPESYEGHEAHRLVFRFEPRLSWTEQYYARRKEGRITIWVSPEGVPLASESKATYEGKTSRMSGRFEGSTIIRTRYALEGSRLRVADRDSEEMKSRNDGGEVERSHMHFVLTGR